MDIYDNLRLVSYAAAAEAFDKSKNVFHGFLPMVESMLYVSPQNPAKPISFTTLRNRINNTYRVSVPKDTLRYLVNLLVEQKKVHLSGKSITPVIQTFSQGNENEAEIEELFSEFKQYLADKRHNISKIDIREQICKWIYIHSCDLAEFVHAGIMSSKLEQLVNEDEWEYAEDLLLFLLDCKDKNKSAYTSFIRLFDGAVQTSLLNFTPTKIRAITGPEFNIDSALLDTNFLLRLLELQSPLDNEAAIASWESLNNNGTHFFVLRQTIHELCLSVKSFLSEITSYSPQVREFLPKAKIPTTGFYSAFQNGVTRTEFYEYSKEEKVRKALTQKYSITVIEDFDDSSISEESISALIQAKNKDKYSHRHAYHDLLLISYCRNQRSNKVKSFCDAQWWVITNDRKLTFWNQNHCDEIQECITEVQLSNLMWLQAKKNSNDGLANTIVALASQFAVEPEEISSFARQIENYRTKNLHNTHNLNSLALVFAGTSFTADDFRKANEDEQRFDEVISKKATMLQAQQAQQERALIASQNSNTQMEKKIQALTEELNRKKLLAEKNLIEKDIVTLNAEISKVTLEIENIKKIQTFCEARRKHIARRVLIEVLLPFLVIVFLSLKNTYKLVYNLIVQNPVETNVILSLVSGGIITFIVLLLYYVAIIFVFGAPYKPNELFSMLCEKRLQKERVSYIIQNHFNTQYADGDLDFLSSQYQDIVKKNRVDIENLNKKLSEIKI